MSKRATTPHADPSRFGSFPPSVGIVSLDAYFPRRFVSQADLEASDGVSAGKYTVGLGQAEMAFCSDREDIYSMCLTAVRSFMEKHGVSYADVGRLEVATETILDHSKAVKTVLMQLFEASGNSDVEGVDTMNACYGGTNALFNSVQWVESSAWDGRMALVVAADIAEYARGPARPTGGAGVVVMLVGPGAPLALERGCRGSHMEHAYDFYKPNMDSPFPVVDGKLSQTCYLRSVDQCYRRYCDRFLAVTGGEVFEVAAHADRVVFHAPYNKLVQKSMGRLLYNDFARFPERDEFKDVYDFIRVPVKKSYEDRALEKAFVAASAHLYASRVIPSTQLPKRLGNLYTASLYAGLLSLVCQEGSALAGKRVLMFSYGSGLASTMFSIRAGASDADRAALDAIRDRAALPARLDARARSTPEEFHAALDARERLHGGGAFKPQADPAAEVEPGTYYLVERDERGRREYARRE